MKRITGIVAMVATATLFSGAIALAQSDYGPAPAQVAEEPALPQSGEKFHWPDSLPDSVAGMTTRSNVKGTLAIQAVQGTPGGRPIGAVEAEVELHHRGMLLDTIKVQLDEHGVALVEDLPVSMGVEPTVRVYWADLSYLVTGTPMDANNSQQKIEVVCYEPTEQPPPWKVLMRHVMVSPAPEGFFVTEVIVIENPENQTWIGKKKGDAATPKRMTTAFKLPDSAENVELGRGFHDWCCSTLDQAGAKNTLVNHLPLMPGTTQMIFGYQVPAKKGKATLDIVAPAELDHMMVIVPDAVKIDSFTGLEDRGVQSMGGGAESEEAMRAFMAAQQTSGQTASITLLSLRREGPAVASTASQALARTAAMVGGVAIVVIAIALLFLKRTNKSQAGRTPVTFDI